MNTQEEYCYYWRSANEQEKKVLLRMGELEPYFDDMLFRKCWIDTWDYNSFDIPDELGYYMPYTIVRIEDLGENVGGCYDTEADELIIPATSIEKDYVLLHEMIHIYEEVLNKQPIYFHDSLYWTLYIYLKERIDNLDNIITEHANLLNEYSIYSSGGTHGVLFLLKSFELDIRMNYPLGTVFGYGYLDEFKKYNYKKEPTGCNES